MVEAIWDSLRAEPGSVPVPASHVRELKRRLVNYEANPEATVAWDEAKGGAVKKLAE